MAAMIAHLPRVLEVIASQKHAPKHPVWVTVTAPATRGSAAFTTHPSTKRPSLTFREKRRIFHGSQDMPRGCSRGTSWSMARAHFIAARVSSETKARFRSIAEQQQMTTSGLLKRLIDSVVRSDGEIDAKALKPSGRELRGSRTSVRLHPDDKLLLRERAASRQLAVATYISVLVRAHLRNFSPLPKDELMALKRSVAELSAIGRNLNQLTRLAHQGAGVICTRF